VKSALQTQLDYLEKDVQTIGTKTCVWSARASAMSISRIKKRAVSREHGSPEPKLIHKMRERDALTSSQCGSGKTPVRRIRRLKVKITTLGGG